MNIGLWQRGRQVIRAQFKDWLLQRAPCWLACMDWPWLGARAVLWVLQWRPERLPLLARPAARLAHRRQYYAVLAHGPFHASLQHGRRLRRRLESGAHPAPFLPELEALAAMDTRLVGQRRLLGLYSHKAFGCAGHLPAPLVTEAMAKERSKLEAVFDTLDRLHLRLQDSVRTFSLMNHAAAAGPFSELLATERHQLLEDIHAAASDLTALSAELRQQGPR